MLQKTKATWGERLVALLLVLLMVVVLVGISFLIVHPFLPTVDVPWLRQPELKAPVTAPTFAGCEWAPALVMDSRIVQHFVACPGGVEYWVITEGKPIHDVTEE